jgi:hypothetical protein
MKKPLSKLQKLPCSIYLRAEWAQQWDEPLAQTQTQAQDT